MVFQEIQCLHNFNHDDVHHVTELISLPSFMFVSAAVSEIHDLNQNKKEKKQFTTFSRHITDPFFNESYLLTTSTHYTC